MTNLIFINKRFFYKIDNYYYNDLSMSWLKHLTVNTGYTNNWKEQVTKISSFLSLMYQYTLIIIVWQRKLEYNATHKFQSSLFWDKLRLDYDQRVMIMYHLMWDKLSCIHENVTMWCLHYYSESIYSNWWVINHRNQMPYMLIFSSHLI